MSYYEIWLDESGNFCDESINKNKIPSLVGGVIIKGKQFTEECAKEILGTTNPIHAAEIYQKDLENLLNISIDKLIQFNIHPVIFENRERVSIVDPQTTYLSVFAEGIMQLMNDLSMDENIPVFNLHIARRMYKKDDVLTRMRDEEYISRLTERISLLKMKNPNLSKLNNYKINIKLGSAREDRRLMVSDLICHAWYSKKYKFSQKSQEKLEKFLEGKVYSIIEPGGLASIRQRIKTRAFGEGLFEWIGHFNELKQSLNATKENVSKLLSLKESLCSKLELLNRSERNMQLTILANYIKALVNYSKQFELAIPYVKIFFEEIVPSLKSKNVDTSRIEAEAHFSLLTFASNTGKVSVVEEQIEKMEFLIKKLAKRWENLDFIFEYYIRKGAYLYTINAYDEVNTLMNKLESMVSGIAEISASILSDELDTGVSTVNSNLLGKIYGVRSQTYLRMGILVEKYLDLAESNCYLSLEQFESNSDKSRHYQTLAEIESLRKNFMLAEKFIAKSLFIEDTNPEKIFMKIVEQPLFMAAFSWMHYLNILSEAFVYGDSKFASERFLLLKNYLRISEFVKIGYPNNLILEKYAICQIYCSEYSSGINNFEKSLAISFDERENELNILIGINTIAAILYVMNEKNKLNEKLFNKYKKFAVNNLNKIQSRHINFRGKSLVWDSLINGKEYRNLDFKSLFSSSKNL